MKIHSIEIPTAKYGSLTLVFNIIMAPIVLASFTEMRWQYGSKLIIKAEMSVLDLNSNICGSTVIFDPPLITVNLYHVTIRPADHFGI